MKTTHEQRIRRIFEVSLVLKGLHGALEIAIGIAAYAVSGQAINAFVQLITRSELLEDPKDLVSNYLVSAAQQLSVSEQHYAAFYLLIHGIIKIALIFGLLRRRLWAYPASIVIFSLFIVYQIYRYAISGSAWLLVFTAFDLLIIWLTVHEYRFIRKHINQA